MPSVKQEPIYLPDVESNPQPGSYRDMIQKMQNSGGILARSGISLPTARKRRTS
jgi:hypothetical protein